MSLKTYGFRLLKKNLSFIDWGFNFIILWRFKTTTWLPVPLLFGPFCYIVNELNVNLPLMSTSSLELFLCIPQRQLNTGHAGIKFRIR